MRHGKRFNHLGRKAAHRKAMLANMACSLIEHKRIKTTLAKAKALRVYVEPLITKSKNDTTHSRRTVFSYLKQKEAITELFGDVAAKITNRAGGYTRIFKLSNRLGDNAKMAFIELVDYNEEYTTDKPKRKKARRAKKRTEAAPVAEKEKSEEPETDEVVEASPVAEKEKSEEPKTDEVVEADPVAEKEKSEEPKADEVVEASPVAEKEKSEESKTDEVVEVQAENKEDTKEEADNSEEKKEKGE
jgi:large subunit ribosomal protein L17